MIVVMNIKVLQFENYLDAINKSVGSDLFQTVWAEINGERKDIINKGQFACAIHVSSILLWFAEFGLIKTRHAGVVGLIKDLEDSGWHKIDKPRVGAIIHWEAVYKNGGSNEHIGFDIGNDRAVSNERDVRTPIEHHYTYGETDGKPNRKMEGVYWHPKLDDF